MKKMMMIVALSVATVGLAAAAVWYHYDDERPINQSELPTKAQEFISEHYSNNSVKHTTIDREISSTEYEIVLDNGTKIEFNESGEWRSIDCYSDAVPEAIVPSKIRTYVKENYGTCAITELKRERYGWEVGLSNGLDLEFDSAYRLTEIDD